jgi:hypothetical protein
VQQLLFHFRVLLLLLLLLPFHVVRCRPHGSMNHQLLLLGALLLLLLPLPMESPKSILKPARHCH